MASVVWCLLVITFLGIVPHSSQFIMPPPPPPNPVPLEDRVESWECWTPCSTVPSQLLPGTQFRKRCDRLANLTLVCSEIEAACNPTPPHMQFDDPWSDCSAPCGGGTRFMNAACSGGPGCLTDDPVQHEIQCSPVPCAKNGSYSCGVDLIFLLDSSASVLEEANHYNVKQCVVDVAYALNISHPDAARLGVIQFSNWAQVEVSLGGIPDAKALSDFVWNLEMLGDMTNTAAGILEARQEFLDHPRNDSARRILIVILDGPAYLDADDLEAALTLIKNDGIEIYVIAVGTEVDKEEVRLMASDPDHHYLDLVSQGYNNLVPKAPALLEKICTELVPTILSDTVDCMMCDCGSSIGYLPDPANCQQYYVCIKAEVKKDFTQYRMLCGAGTYWNQALKTCDFQPGPDTVCDILPPATTTPSPPTSSTTSGPCPYRPFTGDKTKFQTKGRPVKRRHTYSCPSGTEWHQNTCGCIERGTTVCDDDTVILDIPFDETIEDTSCNEASIDKHGNVKVRTDGPVDGRACFDGDDFLMVQFLDNYFANQDIDRFALAFWFKPTPKASTKYGLVSNSGCYINPSFSVYVEDGQLFAMIDTTDDPAMIFPPVTLVSKQWTHVAVVYDETEVTLYINGVAEQTVLNVTGGIENRPCPLVLSANNPCKDHANEHFVGCLDEVKLLKRVLTPQQVADLAMTS